MKIINNPAYLALPQMPLAKAKQLPHRMGVGFTTGAWRGIAILERAKQRARVAPRVNVRAKPDE